MGSQIMPGEVPQKPVPAEYAWREVGARFTIKDKDSAVDIEWVDAVVIDGTATEEQRKSLTDFHKE